MFLKGFQHLLPDILIVWGPGRFDLQLVYCGILRAGLQRCSLDAAVSVDYLEQLHILRKCRYHSKDVCSSKAPTSLPNQPNKHLYQTDSQFTAPQVEQSSNHLTIYPQSWKTVSHARAAFCSQDCQDCTHQLHFLFQS